MLQLIKSYLKFLKNSTNQHGVHSPFVYSLVTKCFYDNKNYAEYEILKKYRKSLLTNKDFIEVTDFGAGSRVFKSNKRQISKIVKTAGISSKRAKLLFRVVNYFQPTTILEIGTSLGLATSALSLGNKTSKIISLEGCSNTITIAKSQLQDINNIEFINTRFEDYFQNSKLQTPNFQLIYFDGNHSKKATLDYFELLLPTTTNETVWIFDDIHWSKDMEEAWEIIKKHPKVRVTIDTFQWGFVFFRTEQEKEHFVVRVLF
ncbi:O-methyltransferase [Flavobacterium ponti]|uniref:O-methyltransferase n=1 Tax=Flavobacterium ponti TaxID=665133 RepID=A0ABV9P7I1_9FLAO